MNRIDSIAIEQRARRLRAEEIRRIEGLFAERLRILGRLLAASVLGFALAAAEAVRPLFAWNPQGEPQATRPRIAMWMRLNRAARALFAWNPMAGHH